MAELKPGFIEQRQHERFDLGVKGVLHTKRMKRSVIIDNISVKGMKVLSPELTIPLEQQLQINQEVSIEWESGQKIDALVVWGIGTTAGIFFNNAIGEDHPLMIRAKANKA
ncbi:MAG: PilZ domain-containing protein [Methyloligellaceae bacterium]